MGLLGQIVGALTGRNAHVREEDAVNFLAMMLPSLKREWMAYAQETYAKFRTGRGLPAATIGFEAEQGRIVDAFIAAKWKQALDEHQFVAKNHAPFFWHALLGACWSAEATGLEENLRRIENTYPDALISTGLLLMEFMAVPPGLSPAEFGGFWVAMAFDLALRCDQLCFGAFKDFQRVRSFEAFRLEIRTRGEIFKAIDAYIRDLEAKGLPKAPAAPKRTVERKFYSEALESMPEHLRKLLWDEIDAAEAAKRSGQGA